MNMSFSSAFAEVEKDLRGLSDLAKSEKLTQVLVDALQPARAAAIGKVHSVTGKTVAAITVNPGRGRLISANLKVDKKIAYAFWYGKPYAYPYAVEFGHGKTPAHPFFNDAVRSARSEMGDIVQDGLDKLIGDYVSGLSIGGEFL